VAGSEVDMERCPYCEDKIFSVALHLAICPQCVNKDEETEEIIKYLEERLKEYLTKLQK
jgi:hypothetical protein